MALLNGHKWSETERYFQFVRQCSTCTCLPVIIFSFLLKSFKSVCWSWQKKKGLKDTKFAQVS